MTLTGNNHKIIYNQNILALDEKKMHVILKRPLEI